MKHVILAAVLFVLTACSKPEPVWTSTILHGPDGVPSECTSDVQAPVPPARSISPEEAARLHSDTLDKFAELRKDQAVCGAWAKRQRPKK